MVRDPRHGGVAPVLHPPDQTADLLDVLARLPRIAAVQLGVVGRLVERQVEQLRRRNPVDQGGPARNARAGQGEQPPIVGGERLRLRGRLGVQQDVAQAAGQQGQGAVREADDPRPQQRRRPQLGRRIGQVAQQGPHVLDLLGVEEAESLVDARRDAAPDQRPLEFAVASPRPEQNGDVAGLGPPPQAAAPVADLPLLDQAGDFAGHQRRAAFDAPGDRDPERRVLVPGGSGLRRPVDREPVVVGEPEGVPAGRLLVDGREQVVDEAEQLRPGAKAVRDPLAHALRPVRAQRRDRGAGFLDHRDVGVPETVDRLLAVADHEDAGRQRGVVHQPAAFAPRLHEQRDQLPLGAAGVLELVDEHVVIARLEPVPGARELVHPAQQVDGALEDVGEVEQRARLELAAILGHADVEEALHAAHEGRVHVAVEAAQHVVDHRGQRRRGRAEAADARRPAPRTGVGETLARGARPRQEVRPQPVEGGADAGRSGLGQPADAGQIARHHGEGAVLVRPVLRQAPRRGRPVRTLGQAPHRRAAGVGGARAARRAPQDPSERGGGGGAAAHELGHRLPHAPGSELRQQHGDVGVPARRGAGRRHGPLDRLPDDVRYLGLVGDREVRIEVGFERELPQQRQAEGVDGADADLAEPVAQLPPARLPGA